MAQYTPQDQVLLGSIKTYRLMPYTDWIWNSWEALCRHLLLAPIGNSILAHWRMEDILKHLQPYANLEGTTRKAITTALGKLSITQAAHTWDNTSNSWISLGAKMACTRIIPLDIKEQTMLFLANLQEANSVTIEDTDLDQWITWWKKL